MPAFAGVYHCSCLLVRGVQECIDGYHWVEDEFYLTTCGGEVIIGSAALLAEEEGMEDYCGDGAGEEGGMFSMEDNDDAIADDAQDDFYCIRMPRESSSRAGTRPVRPVSGGLGGLGALASRMCHIGTHQQEEGH